MTALELGKKIKAGEISVTEAVESVLETIEKKESSLHCYITVLKERALWRAAMVQKRIDSGELKDSPLAGVPFAVKDNICTKGILTTCGSRMLSDFIPPYTASAVERLENAGAVLIGKTNMDEFAMGNSTETSYYGSTKNPFNQNYSAGGSSGGAAAAVASGEAYFSLGSDTGGSIRQPSSFCGVTGIKPTYGMVSRYGLIAYASSFDQIGPIGKDVSDCAAVLETAAGWDKKDAASFGSSFSISGMEGQCINQIRIGILRDSCGASEAVRKAIDEAIALLLTSGLQMEEVVFGLTDYAAPAYYILAYAEASSNLARYDGIRYGYRKKDSVNLSDLYKKSRTEGFGTEVKRRIMMGTFALSTDNYEAGFQKALKVRRLIKNSYDAIFARFDVLLSASAPHTAYLLGNDERNPWERYMEDQYTAAANLAGFPSMSIPCGTDENGLPIGLMLSGKPFGEHKMLKIASVYEQIRKGVIK